MVRRSTETIWRHRRLKRESETPMSPSEAIPQPKNEETPTPKVEGAVPQHEDAPIKAEGVSQGGEKTQFHGGSGREFYLSGASAGILDIILAPKRIVAGAIATALDVAPTVVVWTSAITLGFDLFGAREIGLGVYNGFQGIMNELVGAGILGLIPIIALVPIAHFLTTRWGKFKGLFRDQAKREEKK